MKQPGYLTSLLTLGFVAYSSVPETVLKEWQNLELVTIEINNQRRRIVAVNPDDLALWRDAHYPDSMADLDQASQRAHNIAQKRNSKGGLTTHSVQPILLKWYTGETKVWPAQWTTDYGFIGVRSDRLVKLPWPEKWALLLVENWESFYQLDYSLPGGTLVAMYLGGQVSDITLQCIVQLPHLPTQVLHWGDYDWTGLQIYQRVRQSLPQVTLYVPPDIKTLFARYSRYELINQPIVAHENLPPDSQTQFVVDMISQYNGGLEQEIVAPPSHEAFSSLWSEQ